MKITRNGNQRLEIVTGNYLLPGWFILLGGGGFIHELFQLVSGEERLTDFKSAVPLLATALFLVVGLALFRHYSCRIDLSQQQVTWKSTGLLTSKIRVLPLKQVNGADFEVDPNNFANSHPQWGPPRRLVLLTAEGALPFSDMYTTCGTKEIEAQNAINEFLGLSPPSFSRDQDIRALIAKGQLIAAIKLVRERRGCGLAEAKAIVESLK